MFEFLCMKDGEIVDGDSVTVGMCAVGRMSQLFPENVNGMLRRAEGNDTLLC